MHGEPRELAGATCIVTGGAGFIGQHLVARLLAAGARVRVLDRSARLSALRKRAGASMPPPALHGGAALETVELDLGGARELAQHLRGGDYLFHLAAEKQRAAREAPERALQVNVLATERLLHAAAECRLRKVVFTSSLYAHGGRHGIMREHDVPEPDSVYGVSKLAGEHLLRHAARDYGLPGTSLRLFFIYGPGQDEGSATRSLIVHTFERILRGQPAQLRGDGRQALDYLYVDDAVDALLCALSPAADDQLFNIGSGHAVSVEQLVLRMLTIAGAEPRIQHVAADDTHGTRRMADITRARAQLGWQPSTSLDEGLRRTLAWLRARDRARAGAGS